jgi:hypothetical protein
MKRKSKKKKGAPTLVVGVAWYRREQWPRLREIAADPEMIEETYEEWFEIAEERFGDIRLPGVQIKKVDVDVEELMAWCQERGFLIDSRARAQYVSEKVRGMGIER